MRFIGYLPPGARPCAVIPGRQKDPRGFIDTGNELVGFDPHVYLSYEGVKQAALLMGFVEAELLAGAQEELADANHRISQLEQELQEYDRRFAAIDLLESEGFTARRKVGRPKTKVT